MTDEQINKAIFEACGWKCVQSYQWIDSNGLSAFSWDIPDYCTDLNAMADAEKSLRSEQWQLYAAWLFKATGRPQSATARQRAEAFLRTIVKWEEATDKDSLLDQKEVAK